MNNSKISKLILILIGISIILGIYLFSITPLDNNIINKNWYSFNIKTRNIDKININNQNIDININNNLNCKKYNYNNRNKTLHFDCNLLIKIKNIKENQLVLDINSKEKNFFLTPEESINYEFEKYFGKTISEFEKYYSQSKEIIKIDYKEIEKILNNDKAILIFMGNNCKNIECILILQLIEKWIVFNENVYYIDANEYTKFGNYFNDLKEESYNSEFPIIYIIDQKQISKKVLKCNGLDCSNWYNISKIN